LDLENSKTKYKSNELLSLDPQVIPDFLVGLDLHAGLVKSVEVTIYVCYRREYIGTSIT